MAERFDEIDRLRRRGHQRGGVEHASTESVPASDDVNRAFEVLEVVCEGPITCEAATDIAHRAPRDVIDELRDVRAEQFVISEKEAILLYIACGEEVIRTRCDRRDIRNAHERYKGLVVGEPRREAGQRRRGVGSGR